MSRVQAASEAKGLELENPPEWGALFDPFERLAAPFELPMVHLYSDLSNGERMKLMRLLISGDKFFKGMGKGCGMDIEELESTKEDNKHVLAVFPLHDRPAQKELETKWIPLDWPWKLPLSAISDYFGEEIGFYFGFLGHLTHILMPLALVACVAQWYSMHEMTSVGERRLYASSLFAIFGVFYYGAALDKWSCDQSSLAMKWNTFGSERLVPARPGFDGTILKDPVTGRLVIDFPEAWRRPRSWLTFVASMGMLTLLFGTVTLIFVYKAALKRRGAGTFESLLPSLLNAAQVGTAARDKAQALFFKKKELL